MRKTLGKEEVVCKRTKEMGRSRKTSIRIAQFEIQGYEKLIFHLEKAKGIEDLAKRAEGRGY